MPAHAQGLTTRQFERVDANLPAEFVIAQHHCNNVCFSATSAACNAHMVRGRVTDVSPGGIGLVMQCYVPRMCDGVVRVFAPGASTDQSGNSIVAEVIFEHAVKVRRVAMCDHTPTYSVGMAFQESEPDIEQRVNQLLHLIRSYEGKQSNDLGAEADNRKEQRDA